MATTDKKFFELINNEKMSKRCKLQKEFYKEVGNYKGSGKYSDEYVKWLEDKIIELRQSENVVLDSVSNCEGK